MWHLLKSLFSHKENPPHKIGSWVFDETIASRFTDEAEKHIPHYWKVITLSALVIKTTFGRNAKILDVGCATGNTLVYFVSQGFEQLFGCDSSAAMLTKARQCLPQNHVVLVESAFFPTNVPLFEVVMCNWTMHFIEEREQYLQAIFKGLVSGGLLIMTEKTEQSDAIKSLYHDFKLQQGLTVEQIAQKEQHLKGILVPYSLEQNIALLKDTGFIKIEILDASLGFVTFLAWKP